MSFIICWTFNITMIKIPGNLETAHLSCGAVGCHPGIKERVEKSMMNIP